MKLWRHMLVSLWLGLLLLLLWWATSQLSSRCERLIASHVAWALTAWILLAGQVFKQILRMHIAVHPIGHCYLSNSQRLKPQVYCTVLTS